MSQLVITGASGLLGANLVLETERSFDVTAVVHKHPLKFATAQVIQADLGEASTVRELFGEIRPDWIIHCAADTAIDALEADPARANRLNIRMSREVAKGAASINARLLYVSTDSVFDGRNGPYRETDEPNPLNVYARSKLDGERAVAEENPGALIVRTNLFGWSPIRKTSLAEWFYTKLNAGQPCSGFSDIYFSPVYAPDLARIFMQMLDSRLEGLYHVPGDECLSKYEFGCRLAVTFRFNSELISDANSDQMQLTAKRPKRTCLDGSKINKVLGKKLPALEEGLTRFRVDQESGLFEGVHLGRNREEPDA